MALRETMAQAGYRHERYDPVSQLHTLVDLTTGRAELWFANKNHASYGIIYKNTVLEFARGLD